MKRIASFKNVTLIVGLVVFLTLARGQAFAGPKIVVDDNLQCPNAQYISIQAAVNAAPPGAEIRVCPGTYIEQVTIPAGKNGLTLRSEKPLDAIIKAPLLMLDPKAIVRVNVATDVTIRGFTITGPGGLPCDSIRFGVLVDGGGSATIRDNHITEIHDTPFSGCQNGNAVQVGRFATGPGRAFVFKNIIDNFQKNGITVNEAASSAEVSHNEVTGVGPTSVIAQNGIQVGFGATADVHHNEVSELIYTPGTFASAGILLFQPGVLKVEHNKVTRTDEGIYSIDATNPIIRYNRTSFNSYDGIGLDETTGGDVSHNHSSENNFDGIWVDSDSTNNSITNNKLLDNGLFDAEDNSVGTASCGTANHWDNNHCETDNRGGCLCGHNPNAGTGNNAMLQSAAAFPRIGAATRTASPRR